MALIISEDFIKGSTILATTTSQIPLLANQLPDNCHTVIIYNPDSTNDLYVAIGTGGEVLDPTGAGGKIPTIIKAGASLSIGMGALSLRPQSSPNDSSQLIYQTSAGTIQVNITYICSIEF
jgi:hypothetical protein